MGFFFNFLRGLLVGGGIRLFQGSFLVDFFPFHLAWALLLPSGVGSLLSLWH